jgi:DNA-binding transcriptional LysR family regulator
VGGTSVAKPVPSFSASRTSDDNNLRLPGLLGFVSVARHLSFVRAAAELAITPAAMSKSIKQLEAQLGLRLFNRTTRSVSLTEAGEQLHASVLPGLEQIRHALAQLGETATRPRGVLRINTSFVAYATLIEPHLSTFLARHPEVTLEVAVDNSLSDIVADGFDAGIRLGHALHRDMVSLPLGPLQQRVVVASPGYLRRAGSPDTPEALLDHQCIRQRLTSRNRLYEWEFKKRGRLIIIDVRGRLVFDEMRSVLAAARDDCGLGFVFRHFAARELASGALVTVLDKFCPSSEAFHIYFPHRAQMPGKLRAFIDFVRAANWQVPS